MLPTNRTFGSFAVAFLFLLPFLYALETYQFQEDSAFGMVEGTVVLKEAR